MRCAAARCAAVALARQGFSVTSSWALSIHGMQGVLGRPRRV